MSEGYQPEPSGIKNPTPPNTGSHVKPAPQKELVLQVLQTLKESVDAYALAFDPCDMCGHQDKSKKENLETCLQCCYYYASKFEPKETK